MNMPFKTKMEMSVNYLKGNTRRQIHSDKKKKVITVRASVHLRHVCLTEPLNSTQMLYEHVRSDEGNVCESLLAFSAK